MDSEEFVEGELEEVELVVEPVPPDTVDSVKAAFEPLIRQSLKEAGQTRLLDEGEIALDLEQTFPRDAAVTALFYLASGIALKTFEATVLPDIQRKYQAWVKKRNRCRKGDVLAEQAYRTKLCQLLSTHFDEEELRTLCFDLGIDYDDLRSEGKANKARELVAYLERRGRIPDLVAIGKRLRPHVNWEDPSTET
jgi:hypothetical protein